MQIFVKSVSGKTLTLALNSLNTICTVKARLQGKVGLSLYQNRPIFLLEGGFTLAATRKSFSIQTI
jgi:ubiquitin C